MPLKEIYEKLNGDYEGVVARLMKEERVEKYLRKFGAGDDYNGIADAIGNEDWETAFRNVHSLKGMSANLGLTQLFNASDVLCEELRGGKPDKDISDMLESVRKEYELTIETIRSLGE